MGVYITGMDMPKNCWDCPFANKYFYECFAADKKFEDINDYENSRPDFCPLVEQTMDEKYYLNLISTLSNAITQAQEALSVVRKI